MSQGVITAIIISFFGSLLMLMVAIIGYGVKTTLEDIRSDIRAQKDEAKSQRRVLSELLRTNTWLITKLSTLGYLDAEDAPAPLNEDDSNPPFTPPVPERRKAPRTGPHPVIAHPALEV